MRLSGGAWAAAILLAGLLAACGPGTSPSGRTSPSAPFASPSPTASASPAASPPASPSPVACPTLSGGTPFPGGGPRPSIVDVRVGDHGTYERVVVEFTSTGIPPYRLEPNPTTPPGGTTFTGGARGDQIVVLGSYGLLLTIQDLDWMQDSYAHGKDLKPQYQVLKEVRVTGDFEAIVTVGFGLSGSVCPAVSTLQDPPRLVIDFPVG